MHSLLPASRWSACRFGLFALVVCSASAGDWPQYRGPDQTGTSQEKVQLDWSAHPPKTVWRVPTNLGFSSFAVSGGKAFTLVTRQRDGEARETCVALDAADGKELWAADLDLAKYAGGGDSGAGGNNGGDGCRSTPSASGDKVYAYSSGLILYCFDAASGKKLWSQNVLKDFAGRNPHWSSAESPVVEGDLVLVGGGGPGASLLAFDKNSGKLVWKAFDEKITHATPVATTILGQRQVIFFLQSGLLAVAPETGKALWRFSVPFKVSTAASPVVSGDLVYASAGYGVGGAVCRIRKQGETFQAEEVWRIPGDQKVPSHWSTPVAKDGYLYGMFSVKKYGSGPLKCVELATGKIAWEKPGFGSGNVILVGDKVLALADDGSLVVVAAAADGYHELARTKAVKGKCWSTPALADGRIYVRSTKEGACLDVSP